jgi:hypothetical protein
MNKPLHLRLVTRFFVLISYATLAQQAPAASRFSAACTGVPRVNPSDPDTAARMVRMSFGDIVPGAQEVSVFERRMEAAMAHGEATGPRFREKQFADLLVHQPQE